MPMANPEPQLPSENPALLALGEQLPKVEQAYRDARATWDAMWKEWSPQWPLAPEPCCKLVWLGSFGDGTERDLTGAGLLRPGQERPAKVMTIKEMESRAGWMRECMAKDDGRKRKVGRKTRAYWEAEANSCELGIQLLPGYQAECARIKAASNVEANSKARSDTAQAMFKFARKVLAEPHHTAEGLKIKASAVAMLGNLQRGDAFRANMVDCTDNAQEEPLAVLIGKAVLAAG